MTPPPHEKDSEHPSLFKRISTSFKRPFTKRNTEAVDTTPPSSLIITQEFEDQQLRVSETPVAKLIHFDQENVEATTQSTGAIPKVKTTANPPTPEGQRQKEKGAYSYLASLARQLQDFDESTEEERKAFLRQADTILSTGEATPQIRVSGPTFFETFGNKNIEDVPWDELLFEFKHHLLINHRAAFSDDFLLEGLRAVLVTYPEIKTPVQLFDLFEFQTNYSPLTSPSFTATVKQQPSGEAGPPPYEQNSPSSFPTQNTSEQAFNPNSLPGTEAHTSTPIKYGQVDQAISVPSDLLQLPPQRFQSLPDLTPVSIQPILDQNLTRRTNRKVSFSPVMATPSTITQDIFDKKYTDELDRLVMGGLSIQLAIPAALTLAQASTPNPTSQQTQQNLAQGTIPAQFPLSQTPSTNSFQPSTNLVTPVLTSTRQLGAASATGFQFMGSAIPPSGINPSQNPLRPPFSHSTTRISQPIPTGATQNVTTNTGQSLNPNTNPNLHTTQPTNNNSNQGNIISNTPIPVKNNPSSSQQTINTQLCSSYMLTPEEKAKKIKQGQAMQAMISVSIFCDRETSGRFDDWIAHLESALDLGEFEEGRKLQLLRTKLYGAAAEELDTFKLENPIRANCYKEVKARLMRLFHSMETRSQRSVEFHNMSREPEENMRRYANRMRKAFHLAYPLINKNDLSTNASREQMLMDRFIEGLQPDLQIRLKHKDFHSFEKLIDKAELLAMAMEEAQTRSRIHAVYAAREESTSSSELARVVEALERLTEKIEKKASTHNDEIQNSLALMKKHLAQPQVKFNIPNPHYTHQPHAFRRNVAFCNFHNTWGTHTEEECTTKAMMVNDKCNTCHQIGHRASYCPTIKNPKPPPPPGVSVEQPSSGPNPGFGGN